MALQQQRRLPYTIIVILVLIFAPRLCSTFPLSQLPSATSRILLRRASDSQCGFEGQVELYGLGIRLGVYLQWFSSLLANRFHAHCVPELLATNTIFLLALFIALAIISAQETVRAAEVVILLQFCFGFLTTVSTIWGLRVRARILSPKEFGNYVYFSLLGSTVRLCLTSAIYSYTIWFWFVGADKLRTPSCQTIVFLFAPVDILGGARIFFKIIAVLTAILFGFATASEILLFAWTWAYYILITTTAASVIAFHRTFHPDGLPKKPSFISRLGLKYGPAILVAIPWIMMNKCSSVGKRLQLWLIFRLACMCVSVLLLLLLDHVRDFMLIFSKKNIQSLLVLWLKTPIIDGIKVTPSPPAPPESAGEEQRKELCSKKTEVASVNGAEHDSIAIADVQSHSGRQHRESDSEEVLAMNSPKSTMSNRRQLVEETTSGDSPTVTPPSTTKPATKSSMLSERFEWKYENLKAEWKTAGDVIASKRIQKVLDVLPIINLICLIWSIVAIELMIKWNNITDVYNVQSVSQLIPFIIGIVGFLKLLRDISVERSNLWIYSTIMGSLLHFDVEIQKTEESMDGTSNTKIQIKTDVPNVEEPICIPSNMPSDSAKEEVKSNPDECELKDPGPAKPNTSVNKSMPTATPALWGIVIRIGHNLAKDIPMLQSSIGDKLIETLEKDTSQLGESTEKTNAILAVNIFKEVKRTQTQLVRAGSQGREHEEVKEKHREFLNELHHIDISPNELMMKWINAYTKEWWDYIQKVWKDLKENKADWWTKRLMTALLMAVTGTVKG